MAGDLTKNFARFLYKTDRSLKFSLSKLCIPAEGFAEGAKTVSVRLMIDFGAHAAVSTSPSTSVRPGVASAARSPVSFALVSSSLVLLPHMAVPVAPSFAWIFLATDGLLPYHTGLDEDTTSSVLDLCSLIYPHVPTDCTVSCVAVPGKSFAKRMLASSNKLPYTQTYPSPIFVEIKLKVPSSSGDVETAFSLRLKLLSVACHTDSQQAQSAILSGAPSIDKCHKDFLLVISGTSNSSDTDP